MMEGARWWEGARREAFMQSASLHAHWPLTSTALVSDVSTYHQRARRRWSSQKPNQTLTIEIQLGNSLVRPNYALKGTY